MDNKIKKILSNFSYVLFSNLLTVFASLLVVLILPKVMGVEEYGYWQLYIFYLSYVGFFHLGWLDGIYLRFGGKDYYTLDKSNLLSQITMLSIYLLSLSTVFLIFLFSFIPQSEIYFVYFLLVGSMFVTIIRDFLVYILQMTNRLKEASVITSADRILYLLSLSIFLLVGIYDYKVMIFADLFGRFLSLVFALWTCRDIFGRASRLIWNIKEVFENIGVGINLMLSNIASMLIIGVVRLGIQKAWDIETFGKISLTLSISNLMMTFINAIGLVVFPLLKRTKEQNLPIIYNALRNILMPVMFGVLLLYYPLKQILDIWLPAYQDALVFMALIFPMSVYEGKMALLINTYLKALRMERQIFYINLSVMFLSLISTFITTLLFHNLNLAIISIVILLAIRCIISEHILSKKIQIKNYMAVFSELFMTVTFIIFSWFLPTFTAFSAYFIIYLIYLAIKYKSIITDINKLKQF